MPSARKPARKVLLVDDEPDIRTIARISLSQVGRFEVVDVASGVEALERVAEERPDVILLDVMMPDMDGPMTLERLRETDAAGATPVIFLTAKVQQKEVERYRALGAAGVIAKPFDPLTLADEVRRILG